MTRSPWLMAFTSIACAAALVVGCWADFPDGRLPDGSPAGDLKPPSDQAPQPNEHTSDCPDRDGDKYSTCDGDCNDEDPNVRPDQRTFFTEPTATGSFDYNCDGIEELESAERAGACRVAGDGCSGSGWQGRVPECGELGSFVVCERSQGRCVAQSEDRRQGCR